MEISSQLDLMLFLMKLFSDRFGNQAIIRGGMALRVLDSRRSTNDIDYAFVPYTSKKDIKQPVLDLLGEVSGLECKHELNSQCLRVFVTYQAYSCQIEIKVLEKLSSKAISTGRSFGSNVAPFIVRIADLNWSLTNKLAAWWERGLARDLYDIYYLHSFLEAEIDLDTLRSRVNNLRCVKNINRPKVVLGSDESLSKFGDLFINELSKVKDKHMLEELSDYFEAAELDGLELKIKRSVREVCLSL